MNTKTINVLLGLFLFLFVAIFLQTKEGFIEGASDESSTPKPCSQWSHTEEDKNSKKNVKKKKRLVKKEQDVNLLTQVAVQEPEYAKKQRNIWKNNLK